MKKKIVILAIVLFLAVAAYFLSTQENEPEIVWSPARMTISYSTFDEFISKHATDVVIVRYVRSQPFGESLIEFEFEVLDRVLGNAADIIFVYANYRTEMEVWGEGARVEYRPGDLDLSQGVDYLLPLMKIVHPHATIHEDGFQFMSNIIIDLEEPSNSIMYSESLNDHSEMLDFDSDSLTHEMIIDHVEELTRGNLPPRTLIQSEKAEDIINGSPYVLVIEINELHTSDSEIGSDWRSTDIYHVTLIEALKGDIDKANVDVVTFGADTVSPGEQHIVAVEPLREGSTWFSFTSRNSLFSMDQLKEIQAIIDNN